MSMRVIKIANNQIVSSSAVMQTPVGAPHVRAVSFVVPQFKDVPDITVTVYSSESQPNPGKIVAPWAVEYVPASANEQVDRIVVSAASAVEGEDALADFTCSMVAIGEAL